MVNLDPHNAQEGATLIPAQLGLPPVFAVEDLLTGAHYDWRIGTNYVRLEPGGSTSFVCDVTSSAAAMGPHAPTAGGSG